MLLDQPLPVASALTEGGVSASVPVARALRTDASQAVALGLSVGTAVAACMGLLVAAAVATGGGGDSGGRYERTR